MTAYNEKVPFRLFRMPCCGYQLCWVNPRFPNNCPECGEKVFVRLRAGDCTIMESPGWLRIDNEKVKL